MKEHEKAYYKLNRGKTDKKKVGHTNKSIQGRINKWIQEYESTQPGNVLIEEDSFDGSAYYLLSEADSMINELLEACKIALKCYTELLDLDGKQKIIIEQAIAKAEGNQ